MSEYLCDLCLRSSWTPIIKADVGKGDRIPDLLEMTYSESEGLWVCEDCLKTETGQDILQTDNLARYGVALWG